jgi:hypothetical protein
MPHHGFGAAEASPSRTNPHPCGSAQASSGLPLTSPLANFANLSCVERSPPEPCGEDKATSIAYHPGALRPMAVMT